MPIPQRTSPPGWTTAPSGISTLSRIVPLSVLARARARLGDDGWADPLAAATSLATATGEPQRIAPVTAARCEIAWIAGDPVEAHDRAAEIWPMIAADSSPWRRGAIATWLHP